MKKNKNTILPGMRDYGPEEIYKRNYIVNKLKKQFILHGYSPIETPAIEKISLLTNKYGSEADKLIFKILNSGNFLKDVTPENLNNHLDFQKKISNKALRYDLTVPLSRYINTNSERHPLPFRRYQIQPVWRADRPQKGRLREFYQCDIDILGTKSITSESEMISMACNVFNELKLKDYVIKINHRGLFTSILEYLDELENLNTIAISLDKVDKIGIDKVLENLLKDGIKEKTVILLSDILMQKGGNEDKIEYLKAKLINTESSKKSLDELYDLLQILGYYGIKSDKICVDYSIIRGLSYYTGIVFEIIVENHDIGSIAGGGRYEEMIFLGNLAIPGVGMSFGLDRIWTVLEEQSNVPYQNIDRLKILICNLDIGMIKLNIELVTGLRKLGINTEYYPYVSSLKKQLVYANKRNIPFVIFVDENQETAYDRLTSKTQITYDARPAFILKNMTSGEQNLLCVSQIDEVLDYIHTHST